MEEQKNVDREKPRTINIQYPEYYSALSTKCTTYEDIYLFIHKALDVCTDETHQVVLRLSSLSSPSALTSLSTDYYTVMMKEILSKTVVNTLVSRFVPSVWSNEEQLFSSFYVTVHLCFQLICNGLRGDANLEQIIDKCISTQILSEKVRTILMEALKLRHTELVQSIINQIVTSQCGLLQQYDWSVVAVLASDRLAHLNETLLRLTLKVQRATPTYQGVCNNVHDSSTLQTFQFDLNKTQVKQLWQTLKDAKKDLLSALSSTDTTTNGIETSNI